MNSTEIWFLNLGCSWMWSKLLPYCILFLLFSGLSFLLFYIKNFRNLWRILLMVLISLSPVTIYFALHPIYTGDIFDEASEINTSYVFPKSKQLSIFVLKGCPHCKGTIPFIQKLRERNDQISIQYVILGKPNDRFPGFTNEIPSFCEKKYEPNLILVAPITQGNYPCIVLSNNGKAEKKWSNDNFGMKTMDVIESFFE